jgi:predicted nucleotidyltransferase
MIDLTPEQLADVRRILVNNMPEREILAFGSRVTGKAKPFSDLDLAIMGDEPLDFRQFAALKDAFADSNLPFRVDIVDWASTSLHFRSIIKEHSYTLQNLGV